MKMLFHFLQTCVHEFYVNICITPVAKLGKDSHK